jgi:hypothetical protein
MLRAVSAAVLLFLASSVTASNAAHASIIPCTGQSLAKVLDIYYSPGIHGQHIDQLREDKVHLGYLFKGCTGGEWVGFISYDKPPLTLSDAQLRAMLYVAGMNDLPPVPSFWASPQNYRTGVVWLIIGLMMLIVAVLQQLGMLRKKSEEPEEQPLPNIFAPVRSEPVEPDSIPTTYRSALVAVERAASEHARVAVSGTVKAPTERREAHAATRRFGKR